MKKVSSTIVLGVIVLLVPLISVAAELRFANLFPVPSAQSKICEEFVKDLDQLTGGQLKIRYYAAGTLLTAPKIYDGVVQGIADIGFSNLGYTFGRFKETEVLDLPLGFPDAWVANHVANDFYKQFRPKEWDKVHILSFHASPVNVVLSATKPVRKLEDLKGMTLRGLGYIAEVVDALGGTARPIPMPEAYDAVSKHVIDGLMIPMETLVAFRLGEVSKYITECWPIGQVYTFYLIMNKDVWNKQPPNVQKVLNEYPFEEKLATMWNRIDIEGKKYGKDKGIEFIELSPEQAARWKKAADTVIDKYVKSMTAAGNPEKDVRGWISYARGRIDYWTKKQEELKIKSSTGPAAIRVGQ
jgi:TRAP-type transport system periplasmic protein